MQNVKPTDLPCVSNRLSQVSDVMDRVVAIAPALLLPGENQADAKPRDAIEEFLVRDVIDLTWEVFRLRRARAGVLVASMSDGVRKVLDGLGHGRGEGPGYTNWLGHGMGSRRQGCAERGRGCAQRAGLTIDAVTAKTIESKIDSLERLDRMLASAEARRNNALREIDRHRDVLGANVRRSIEQIEDAEFRDVDSVEATEARSRDD